MQTNREGDPNGRPSIFAGEGEFTKTGCLEELSDIPNLLLRNKLDKAISICRNVSEKHNKSSFIWFMFGLVYLFKVVCETPDGNVNLSKMYRLVNNLFEKANNLCTYSPLFNLNLIKDFEEKYRSVFSRNRSKLVNKILGINYSFAGEALKREKTRIISCIYTVLSGLYFKENLVKRSIKAGKRAICLDPHNYGAYWNLNDIYRVQKYYEGLKHIFNSFALNNPHAIIPHIELSDLFCRESDYKEAGKNLLLAARKSYHRYLTEKEADRLILTRFVGKNSISFKNPNLESFFSLKSKANVLLGIAYWSHEDFQRAEKNLLMAGIVMEREVVLWKYNNESERAHMNRINKEVNKIKDTISGIKSILDLDKIIKKVLAGASTIDLNWFYLCISDLEDISKDIHKQYMEKNEIASYIVDESSLDIYKHLIVAKRLFISILFAALKKKHEPKWGAGLFLDQAFSNFVSSHTRNRKSANTKYLSRFNNYKEPISLFMQSCFLIREILRKYKFSSAVGAVSALETYIVDIYSHNSFEEFVKIEANSRIRLVPSFALMNGKLTTSSQIFQSMARNLFSRLDEIDAKIIEIPQQTAQAIERRGIKGEVYSGQIVQAAEGEHKSQETAGEDRKIKYRLILKILKGKLIMHIDGESADFQPLEFAQIAYLAAARLKKGEKWVSKNKELLLPLPKQDLHFIKKVFSKHPNLIETSDDNPGFVRLGRESKKDQIIIDKSLNYFRPPKWGFLIQQIDKFLKWKETHQNKEMNKGEWIDGLLGWKLLQEDKQGDPKPNSLILSTLRSATVMRNALALLNRKISSEILRRELDMVTKELNDALQLADLGDLDSILRGLYKVRKRKQS